MTNGQYTVFLNICYSVLISLTFESTTQLSARPFFVGMCSIIMLMWLFVNLKACMTTFPFPCVLLYEGNILAS